MSLIFQHLVSQLWCNYHGVSLNDIVAPVNKDEAEDDDEPTRHGAAKHQAILSMDMQTWQDIIDTFGLKEPMITHRNDVTSSGPGARGWYS